MNGFPRNYSKDKKRSVDDQRFDNVFYGIPYDEEETSTVAFCNNKPLGQSSTPPGFQKQGKEARKRIINKENIKDSSFTLRKILETTSKSSSSQRNKLSKSCASKKRKLSDVMDDYQEEQVYHATNGDIMLDYNVATLLNMGNTCFLNSVLYALRFTPTFLHNLHHLLLDLNSINSKLKETKTKTSSLGRNGSAVSGSSWRSASSKDLLSIGNDIIPKCKEQVVTEKLHGLFVIMNNLESKGSFDPYQPEALMQAMRDANPLFEGNHQQDAHEFFVEMLSCLRITCDRLSEQIEQNPDLIKPPESTTNGNNGSKKWNPVRRSWKKQLKKKEKLVVKNNGTMENDIAADESEDGLSPSSNGCGDATKRKFGYNFIAEEFLGVSLHRTKCLECEGVSELKEPFLEIQVPVHGKDEAEESNYNDSNIFGSLCVTSEKLCDQNKYYCEICNRYNEAQRTILYEKLPNVLVLHLKRFTTTLSGIQKVNTYVPTPLEIKCFCETCAKVENTKTTPHRYQLSCVIMHLGASMASGHYIAYSRASVETSDYVECSRDTPKSYLTSSSKEMNFLRMLKAKALGNSLSETDNGFTLNSKKQDTQVCQSINCCGIKCKLNLCSPGSSQDWLEFDDEKVKILSSKEFIEMLNKMHESTNTPYLLFYSKVL
ncbi:ubiquitin carboxyl-terminal hydrolase 1 [Dendroctonus ponderosae]|uniref:USP domain-containing protein n=1 Tax=Dendroctonus ponderosae TaxID=77166 RepID=A0AAR5P1G1_DENPD|nr:ubiquitin carboxyl-terminal hydrolase 1 [Dendroctonus ponderosae]KAH1005694.1 hypothetical protein HUJ04_006628 [Dendroctonus ponderosae]KAH1005697.1 hypothetical protein HUJ04_006631 [Dendroctonus ponderosae]KAH1012814.1 hypothetical protein HUJ05_011903 [Dendroctonus ponderosae]KAH1012815.1 hypothetical protein HUJ05_011903 [Dendroctonus ponderosae]